MIWADQEISSILPSLQDDRIWGIFSPSLKGWAILGNPKRDQFIQGLYSFN